ncbi:U-box domain-containing protein 33-like [Asparagus officinalis]|nr:U-box domain-containing protein 33-like [Asparagus officinalis]
MHGLPRSSSTSSNRSSRNLAEIEEEEPEAEAESFYVAVGKEYRESKETLIWALRNVSKDRRLVLVHVHRPAQLIPMMGAKFHVNQLKEEQVRGFRLLEMHKLNNTLDEYLALCSLAKVKAEKLVIEMDDIGKGIVELIAQHGIKKLIMGAAADRQYSKKLKGPKSKTAISVERNADQSCKIWFVCKGNLICTRDAVLDGSEVGRSHGAILQDSSQSYQLRSKSAPAHQTETTNWLASPTQRSRSEDYDSRGGKLKPADTSRSVSFSMREGGVVDPSEGISRGSPASDHSLSSVGSSIGSLPTFKDQENEEALPSVQEPDEELRLSSPSLELEGDAVDDEVYEKLQYALKEAEDAKREAYEESQRRRKAEVYAIEAAQKVKASENVYVKELKQRKGIEVTLARERLELEKLKAQHDEVLEEVQKANGKKAQMQLQITESEQIIKDLQEKLSVARCLIKSLHKEYEGSQQEQEDAIREVKEQEEASTGTQRVMNFSEFTYSEIERATNNFDDSMKIGEGGYGSVYKGYLRHTIVAIKILNSQSMQGQAEFYQEVEILGKVRHPHVVTLIGTCPEAWALIYEYLPKGNLSDRLACKDNTPPLPWHVRTNILAEICSALIFLHSYKPHVVVHGDLKPANILLGSNFTSKLGDFGICRFLAESNTTSTFYKHTQPKGTLIYMDPEFLSSGELTPRSDVYSFGLIMLRVLTGKPALGIIKEVKDAVGGDRLHEILDVSAGDWPLVQAKQLANLGLRCCEIKRKKRPDLKGDAWSVLEPMVKATSSMGSPSSNNCIPSYFMCPIFQEIMKNPQIAADGFTYEAEAIKGWLESGHDTSPMTNLKLTHRDLIPNRALLSAIQEWLQKQN